MEVKEGRASIEVNGSVFYNPKMQGLRNVSVALLNAVGCRGMSLLDATSATGIRAIRYSKECGLRPITALDINRKAYSMCRKNLARNRVRADAINMSIQEFANSDVEQFDVVDLDPFGSPAPYIHDVMKACTDGTILMITATDTAVLCGAHSDACIKQYGARPLHNELCKEAGLRILYGYVARIAAEFNMGMKPLLGIADMHYMRVFVRLEYGAQSAVHTAKANGAGIFCSRCGAFELRSGILAHLAETCNNCGSRTMLFGPLWTGRLHDQKTVSKMRCDEAIIRTISEELDLPMFYSIPSMTRRLGIGAVSHYKVIDALKKKGFAATPTQFDGSGVKTNASVSEVIKAIRASRSY